MDYLLQKFGSGRCATVSSNSVQNESMNEGDMMWIEDDHGDGVSSSTASSGVHEVEISPNGSSFRAR